MKTAIVPAQITTVEDKVAGNLSVQQLVLLMFPLFVSGGVFAVLPPSFGLVVYKFCIVAFIALVCLASALRIKGTLVVYWIVRLMRYGIRPRTYVYVHADTYMRESIRMKNMNDRKTVDEHAGRVIHTVSARFLLKGYSNKTDLKLAVKKGGLHVSYIKEK